MDDEILHEELRGIRNQLMDMHARIAVLEATRALAWKWGTGAGAAAAAAVAIGHTIWSMII